MQHKGRLSVILYKNFVKITRTPIEYLQETHGCLKREQPYQFYKRSRTEIQVELSSQELFKWLRLAWNSP